MKGESGGYEKKLKFKDGEWNRGIGLEKILCERWVTLLLPCLQINIINSQVQLPTLMSGALGKTLPFSPVLLLVRPSLLEC